MNILRAAVSQERRRFFTDDYDLDLTYICHNPNIIAMGFPATGVDALYRNNIDDVARMLNEYHSGAYMIWNLTEFTYDYSKFDNQVLHFPWPDHHAPPLDVLFQICHSMYSWLQTSEDATAIVHCKAGKGRTGLTISAYLIFSGQEKDPHSALLEFARKRTEDCNGVTVPSQKRSVDYLSRILLGYEPRKERVRLIKVILNGCIDMDGFGTCRPVIKIYQRYKKRIYSSDEKGSKQHTIADPISEVPIYDSREGCFAIDLNDAPFLHGDILFKLKHRMHIGHQMIFRMSFHTGFIPERGVWRVTKKDMDLAYKDPRVGKNFFIDMIFERGDIPPHPVNTKHQFEWPWKNIVQNYTDNILPKIKREKNFLSSASKHFGIRDLTTRVIKNPQSLSVKSTKNNSTPQGVIRPSIIHEKYFNEFSEFVNTIPADTIQFKPKKPRRVAPSSNRPKRPPSSKVKKIKERKKKELLEIPLPSGDACKIKQMIADLEEEFGQESDSETELDNVSNSIKNPLRESCNNGIQITLPHQRSKSSDMKNYKNVSISSGSSKKHRISTSQHTGISNTNKQSILKKQSEIETNIELIKSQINNNSTPGTQLFRSLKTQLKPLQDRIKDLQSTIEQTSLSSDKNVIKNS